MPNAWSPASSGRLLEQLADGGLGELERLADVPMRQAALAKFNDCRAERLAIGRPVPVAPRQCCVIESGPDPRHRAASTRPRNHSG